MREFDFTTVPIVDIVNEIIVDGATKNASDIHFDPMENYLKIRMRIDGDLRDYAIIENKYKRNLITRIKLLAGMNITESRLPQDGAIKSNINGKDLDLRVASLPTSFGEKVVIRILDYSMSFEGIESLGFTKENYEKIEQMLKLPNGIILVTGATGSGKSTTVYSMLQRLNNEGTNIITVEDPIEMNIEGINQVQVNSEIGLDFANVLRSILREDPNVILIGEIRDSETAKIAIRSSITGHLVLSTLHTNNSLTTIERLLDMDVERYLLSSSLKGIISQTLAKRLCPKCRNERETTKAEKRIFKKVLGKDVERIYEPVGCPYCRGGYKGRVALQEVLLLNDEIRDAINDGVRREKLRDMIYKKDVRTLFQDGLLKVIDGTTSIEEVFRLVEAEDDVDNIYTNEEEVEVKELHDNNKDENKDTNINNIDTINNNNNINNIINDDTNINTSTSTSTNTNTNNYNYNYNTDKPVFKKVTDFINTTDTKEEVKQEKHDEDNTLNDILNASTNNINYNNNITPKEDINKEKQENNLNVSDNNITNKEENSNKTNEQHSYTDDLINLINQGFFE